MEHQVKPRAPGVAATSWHDDPGARLFAMVAGFLFFFLAALLVAKHLLPNPRQGEWERAVQLEVQREASTGTPGAHALAPVIDAWRRTDWKALERHREALHEVRRVRWGGEHQAELGAVLRSNVHVTTAVARAANLPAGPLPSTDGLGLNAPRPDPARWEMLALLCVAHAAQLEANGHQAEAVQRMVELATLGARFTQPSSYTTLSQHMVGLAMMEMATSRLTDILTNHQVPATTAARAEQQLALIEQQYISVRYALLAEGELYRQAVLERVENPQSIAQLLQFYKEDMTRAEALEMGPQLHGDFLSFGNAHVLLWEELAPVLFAPIWEQPRLNREWLERHTRNRLLTLFFPEPGPLIVRETALLARIALTRQLCRDLIDPGATADTPLTDPFTGLPLRRTPAMIYSLGPDLTDGRGLRPWIITAGPWSEGDIRVFLPPWLGSGAIDFETDAMATPGVPVL